MTNKVPVEATSSMEIISPEYAQELLKKNTNNYRGLCDKTALKYTKLIKEGKWLAGCSSIVIDWNDVLVDGQHTLTGVFKSGTAIKTTIIRNVDPETRYVIDCHKPRSMKDHVGCKAHYITMVNTFLRAEQLNKAPYTDNVAFYKRHIMGEQEEGDLNPKINGEIGVLVSKMHLIFGKKDDPFTSVGIRAALILAVLNGELTKGEAVELFKKLITFRKYKVKKGDSYIKNYKYQSSTRSAVQSSMPTLLSKLVDMLDEDKLPVYTGVGNRWVKQEYSNAREKASKIMLATYQAICKNTCNDAKFSGPLSSQVRKALGL
tara:strand:- start:121 stop:1074 length:954 start_codon:yes stop_codon:yes gene_type:complete